MAGGMRSRAVASAAEGG